MFYYLQIAATEWPLIRKLYFILKRYGPQTLGTPCAYAQKSMNQLDMVLALKRAGQQIFCIWELHELLQTHL